MSGVVRAEPVADVAHRHGPRMLADARTMRALAHPVRIALVEALTLEGPMTATEAGKAIGQSATTCSFHLRQLQHHEFVEVASRGPGRRCRWRLVQIGNRFSDVSDEADVTVAARTLEAALLARYLEHFERWRRSRDSYPEEWRRAAGSGEALLYLTLDEFEALGRELRSLVERYADRLRRLSARPPDAVPVELLVFAFPLRHPPATPGPDRA